jgi:hypothetical protein
MVARAAEAIIESDKVILGAAHTRWLRPSLLHSDNRSVLVERRGDVLLGSSSGIVLITPRALPKFQLEPQWLKTLMLLWWL